MKIIFLFLALLLLLNISVAFGDDSVCSHFYNRLSELPHTKLTLNIDSFISLWNEKRLEGCEVVYESHESMIPGSRVYDLFESFIHTPGWIVNNNLAADGPGAQSARRDPSVPRPARWGTKASGRIRRSGRDLLDFW